MRNPDPNGEAMARDAFRDKLRSLGLSPGVWRRGGEPPDYHLRWNNSRFAVEVTRVMDSHPVGAHLLSTHGILVPLKAVAASIKEKARELGILTGTYAVQLAPIPDLKMLRPRLVSEAIDYIARTQKVDVYARYSLHRGYAGKSISIEKIGPSGAHVGANITIGNPKRETIIRQDIVRLCRDALFTKSHRLRRVRLPRILLLVDSYLYGEVADWHWAMSQLDFRGWHSIAFVPDGGRCVVLLTEEPKWLAR